MLYFYNKILHKYNIFANKLIKQKTQRYNPLYFNKLQK